MIQFNLLPDVKLQFVKAQRTKRLVSLISIGLSGLAVFVLLLSFVTVNIVQRRDLNNLNKGIATKTKQLQSVPELDKVLTVQNQLNTLTGLHDGKPVASRVFTYVSELTPQGVAISSLKIDYVANTISVDGTAPSLDLVNKYVDTLKSTKYASYTTDEAGQKQQADDDKYFQDNKVYSKDTESKAAFTSVVLASYSKAANSATFGLTFNFDPPIFANTNNITLRVPTDTVSNANVLFKKVEN